MPFYAVRLFASGHFDNILSYPNIKCSAAPSYTAGVINAPRDHQGHGGIKHMGCPHHLLKTEELTSGLKTYRQLHHIRCIKLTADLIIPVLIELPLCKIIYFLMLCLVYQSLTNFGPWYIFKRLTRINRKDVKVFTGMFPYLYFRGFLFQYATIHLKCTSLANLYSTFYTNLYILTVLFTNKKNCIFIKKWTRTKDKI